MPKQDAPPRSDHDRARRPTGRLLVAAAVLVLLGLVLVVMRRGETNLPTPGSPTYDEMVRRFQVGVAALQIDQYDHAIGELSRATELVPEEPAAWANLGLINLRTGQFEEATAQLDRAQTLAPDSDAIELLRGLLESRQGRFDVAVLRLRRAVELAPENLRARYALAQEIERQGGTEGDAEAAAQLDVLLTYEPDNLAVLLEKARLAVKREAPDELASTIERLRPFAAGWPDEVQGRFDALADVSQTGDLRRVSTQVVFLRNVLARVPDFRRSQETVMTSPDLVGEPFEAFVRLPNPGALVADPDRRLSYDVEPIDEMTDEAWQTALAAPRTGEGASAVIVANGRHVNWSDDVPSIDFPGGAGDIPPTLDGVLALDWSYDFRTDLVLAGAGGLRLLEQADGEQLLDRTSETGLGPDLIGGDYAGAWTIDVELDGDLDVVLGARDGATRVLQNNGDGTFVAIETFEEVAALRGLVWADLDRDGDPDVATLDRTGVVRWLANERVGRYRAWPDPAGLTGMLALSVADLDRNGSLDVVALDVDGRVLRVTSIDEDGWDVEEVVRWEEWPEGQVPGQVRVFARDLDNNGGLDLVVSNGSESRVWLADGDGRFVGLPASLEVGATSLTDLNGDGVLDLVGLTDTGLVSRALARSPAGYGWHAFRPLATQGGGDQRINSFALGGEIEIRAGRLTQKQPITVQPVHFGLGRQSTIDVARIVWPNGVFQAEFALDANAIVRTEQRLKGSCPWLYTYDGEGMQFVTDFLWRSPLGLRINAQDTAGVAQTEDWVKIRGDQLVPRDGSYDLRITGELWESFYFDYVSLMVVDHPIGSEIFVDERFGRHPPPLAVHVMTPPRPVTRAWDDLGQDVTDIVSAQDDRYLGSFGRGRYQGVTRDHFVEIELGDEVPREGRLWLVGSGWVYPTDSSINVAIAQGQGAPPAGLSLEVLDEHGGWRVVEPDLGFPAGKAKTVLIDLTGVFTSRSARRLRLRTNLEVYWDALRYASGLDDVMPRTERLETGSAELRFRGFSRTGQANAFAPEVPTYGDLAGTGQRWRDLIGYHTRYGDVDELLDTVDDRYVIMTAGDELRLRVPEAAPLPDGWVRDFVLIGDGWIKDGDFNTGFSKTVLPLPSHDNPRYDTPATTLEADPIYRRHVTDWQDYHTRFVAPDQFSRGLFSREPGRGPDLQP